MANNLLNYNPQTLQMPMQNQQVSTQFFPQPQGNVYMINSPLEISNVPVGSGISAAVSLTEGILFIKTLQNGMPAVVGYKLSPLEQIQKSTENVQTEPTSDILSRLEKLESIIINSSREDKLKWQV